MNSIYEFIKAKLFWSSNSEKRLTLPESCDSLLKIESRMPKFDSFQAPKLVPLPPQQGKYGVFPSLCVPRHFGGDGDIQSKICAYMRAICFNTITGNKENNNVLNIINRLGVPKDGGTFWDGIIGRSEGDTPIVICEFITLVNYVVMRSVTFDIKERYINGFLIIYTDYIKKYKPAQLNNHMTWKALFLATSAVIMNNKPLLEHAYYLYNVACDQIKDDGSMPLELARGNKSCSYTLMNLEALVHLRNLFGVDTPKVRAALENFNKCLTDHDNWKKEYKLGNQIHPNDMPASWGWINMFDKPVNFSVPENSYVSFFSECWNT